MVRNPATKSARRSVDQVTRRIQQVPALARRGWQALAARTSPPLARRRGWLLAAALVLLLGGLGAATAAQLLGAGTGTRDAAHLQAAAADQRSAVVRGLSAGAPPGSLTFTDVPVTADPAAPADPGVISGLAANGIPDVALNAYRVAAARIDSAMPGCGIDWSLIAGIGRVESNHGRFGGATLDSDGSSTPEIIGPALDGVNFAFIADTDHGLWDHDTRYDRAVGPMQFIPSTWRAYAIDADGNGTTDPLNINDAALGTAHYLCVAGGNLTTDAGQRAAVLAYNHSDSYVAQVLALAHAYAAGIPVADIPLVGNTTGGIPAPGPYGTPTAGAAPGPALGEADTTTSPDAVPVDQPAPAAAQDQAQAQQATTGQQQQGSAGGQPSAQSGTTPTVPTKSNPAPAPPQQQSGTKLPIPVTGPVTPPTLPSLPVTPPTTLPTPPPLFTPIGTTGLGLLPDGKTTCAVNPSLITLLIKACPTK
jgi:membrane-bound lytic murein transglycosylase B